MKTINVPTGKIIILDGSFGKLECLSIGDYGKEQNIKADFLGLSKDIHGVPNGEVMPLSEKWVITISTQYGCSMDCTFCDVPKVGPGRNATLYDMHLQVEKALAAYPKVGATKRLNVHYARMGEPTFNPMVLAHAKSLRLAVRDRIGRSLVHPVVSTMLPRFNQRLNNFLQDWCEIKNDDYRGCAGLQFSINSTNEAQRKEMFSGNAHSIKTVAEIGKSLPMLVNRLDQRASGRLFGT